MKRALYSLDDEEFITLLERTDQVFRARDIPYMMVGGVATQAHIVKYVCQKEGKTLHELSHSSDFRIQDHLRATDDADITLDTRKIGNGSQVAASKEILEALQEIEGTGVYHSPTKNHLVGVKLERSGAKRPIFRLGLDREADSQDSEVSFNLYYGPQDTNNRWGQEMVDFERVHYFAFFDEAETIHIPFYETKVIPLRVKGPEQLLATKIARAREKDWSDILLLHRHSQEAEKPIDLSKVQALLSAKAPGFDVPNRTLIDRLDKFKYLIK